jgi:hypothetical protein
VCLQPVRAILSYAAVPGSGCLSLLVLCDEGENGVSIVGETPWKGKEGGGGRGEVVCGIDWA